MYCHHSGKDWTVKFRLGPKPSTRFMVSLLLAPLWWLIDSTVQINPVNFWSCWCTTQFCGSLLQYTQGCTYTTMRSIAHSLKITFLRSLRISNFSGLKVMFSKLVLRSHGSGMLIERLVQAACKGNLKNVVSKKIEFFQQSKETSILLDTNTKLKPAGCRIWFTGLATSFLFVSA